MKLLPRHLILYKKIGLLFLRYAKPAIVEQSGLSETIDLSKEDPGKSDKPEEFAQALEDMGPTFIKLGQLLSTRGDLLPQRYLKALERLQDDVEPASYDEIVETIEKGLGVRLSKVFDNFEKSPIGSASLGQVHRAKLRSGREVVVKVQRAGIRERMTDDLEALEAIAEYADSHTDLGRKYRFSGTIEQFRRSLMDELDYQFEAQNLKEMRESLGEFRNIVVPEPIDQLCSSKVLTMEYLDGVKVTELPGVAKTELDGESLADEIFRAYLHQVLVEGTYHADPHPGNLLVTSDSKIALLDLGMVGRIDERMQDNLLHLLVAISDNRADRLSEVALRISSEENPELDKRAFTGELSELVGKAQGSSVQQLEFGSIVMEIMRICAEHGLVIPREMSMLGKTLLNLDRVGIALSPDFNPNESIRRNIVDLASKRATDSLKDGDFMSAVLELKELVTKSPQRINNLITNLSENRFRVDVDAIDEKALIQGFQKIANRISCGAIIAALLIGASIMMNIDSEFKILGYPGFAMLVFIIAIVSACFFSLSILRKDE